MKHINGCTSHNLFCKDFRFKYNLIQVIRIYRFVDTQYVFVLLITYTKS